MDMKFEVAVLPVSDVDRAKTFCESLGFRMDIDYVGADVNHRALLTHQGKYQARAAVGGLDLDATIAARANGTTVSDRRQPGAADRGCRCQPDGGDLGFGERHRCWSHALTARTTFTPHPSNRQFPSGPGRP